MLKGNQIVVINLLEAYNTVYDVLSNSSYNLRIFTYNDNNVNIFIEQLIAAALEKVKNDKESYFFSKVMHILELNNCSKEQALEIGSSLVSTMLRHIQLHFNIPIINSGLDYEAVRLKNRMLKIKLR